MSHRVLCIATVMALSLGACSRASPPDNEGPLCSLPPSPSGTPIDVLVVMDDSPTMLTPHEYVRWAMGSFFSALREALGYLPSLHVGVITQDLGAGPYSEIPGCSRIGGDRGILGQVGGQNRGELYLGSGQRYLVDVPPVSCNIERNGEVCVAHDCTQANCDLAVTPGTRERLLLVEDEVSGCPRCRNYPGELASAFSDYANVGQHGCGFEHQLEAMRKALDCTDSDTSVPNAGFLRQDSYLVVLFVTEEDDCSAREPEILFDPSPEMDRPDSPLGPLTSFRCFEFGVTCDIDHRTVQGPRQNCVPRSENDPSNYLFPVGRYTAFLEGLVGRDRLIVAAIAGPVDDTVTVTIDEGGRPSLDAACWGADFWATPAIRIRAVVDYFAEGQEDLPFESICTEDHGAFLRGLAEKVADKILGS